jgi:putative salt-induced outer membrane protein YdiY
MGKLTLLLSLLFFLAVLTVSADVVETKDGARLVGKILQVDGTTIVLDTAYAGQVKIKQSEVTGITTDQPTHVRLTGGTVWQGQLTGKGDGAVVINVPDGQVRTTVDQVVATWGPEARDPMIIALQRWWAYEASFDLVGKTGNSEQLGSGFRFRATLTGPQDKLQLYSAYDRQITQGQVSTDQLKAGIDYQSNLSARSTWYLRDEAGFDRVKLIKFSNVAAAGLGYDFIKTHRETLNLRAGLANRYEIYKEDPILYESLINPDPPGVPLSPADAKRQATKDTTNATGLDLGLSHSLELYNFSVVTRISFIPSITDFADSHLTHESFLEVPLRNLSWKLRMGITNDYTSRPASETKRLDTTYFTHFVLSFK